MKASFVRYCLLAVLCFPCAASTVDERAKSNRVAVDRLRSFSIQEVSLPDSGASSFQTAVSLGGQPFILFLESYSLRSEGFTVLVQGADGGFRQAEAPALHTYRGHLEGVPESRVAASVVEGKLYAILLLDTDAVWCIEPVVASGDESCDVATHLVYRRSDIIPGPWHCGADSIATPRATDNRPGHPAGDGRSSAGMTVCDIAFDADVEFYEANRWSVANTVLDIENVMNSVSLIYENEVDITYELTTILVRTAEPDPYSSIEHVNLLLEFRSEWNTNRMGIHRDIAHLMTGKDIADNAIGAAYDDVICEMCGAAYGYGFSQSTFSGRMLERVFLTAHELGHNWGADHCDGDTDCAIMCSQLGGCSGDYTHFGEASGSSITATAAVSACLSTLGPPIVFPFCETFDNGINNGSWSYNAVAEVHPDAPDAPSPPYALLIDNCCTECAPAPDEIRSNYIQLGGLDSAILSYHTQHAGGFISSGSQLVIEYTDNDFIWLELNRIASTGIDQEGYDFWVHALPPDAFHDDFRFRFRIEPVSDFDEWRVDNIAVVEAIPDSAVLYVDGEALGSGAGTSWDTAYNELQNALSIAPCFDATLEEVWVREGTYKPDRGTGDRDSTFRLCNGLSVLGGFAGDETSRHDRRPRAYSTFLSGDIGIPGNDLDNCYHVVTADGTDATAVLDGFEITGGRADAAPSDGGAGLHIAGGSPVIVDCIIQGNTGGNGGGILISGGAPQILNTTLLANGAFLSGGGIHVSSGGTPTLSNSLFLGNLAGAFGGALYTHNSAATLGNCLLSGNTATSGAAVYSQFSSALLTNCTLTENTATSSVGGMLSSNSAPELRSCVLWGNTDNGVSQETAQINGSAPDVDYCCIEGWTGSLGGIGNTGEDPLLVDADGVDDIPGTPDDNARLLPDSPVIDAGDPDFIADPGSTDLDGHHRVLCDRVDMGPYEFGAGDFDCDRSLGSGDFIGWSECLTGPSGVTTLSACDALDLDADGDVDLEDFAAFQGLSFS